MTQGFEGCEEGRTQGFEGLPTLSHVVCFVARGVIVSKGGMYASNANLNPKP
jgi:hypothetical protein